MFGNERPKSSKDLDKYGIVFGMCENPNRKGSGFVFFKRSNLAYVVKPEFATEKYIRDHDGDEEHFKTLTRYVEKTLWNLTLHQTLAPALLSMLPFR